MAKRPDENTLRDMAARPGMTFRKMAHELAVDPKTARRWCRDAGINECGTKNRDDETITVSGDTKGPEIVTKSPEGVTGESIPPVIQEQESIVDIIVKLAAKLKMRANLTTDEQKLYTAIITICKDAVRPDFEYLENKLETHFHRGISIEESRKIYRDNKAF